MDRPGLAARLGDGQGQDRQRSRLGEGLQLDQVAAAAQRLEAGGAGRGGEALGDDGFELADHHPGRGREHGGHLGRGLARAAEGAVDHPQHGTRVERGEQSGPALEAAETEQAVGGERRDLLDEDGGRGLARGGGLDRQLLPADQRRERGGEGAGELGPGAAQGGQQLDGRGGAGTRPEQLGAMLRQRAFSNEGAFGLHWTRKLLK